MVEDRIAGVRRGLTVDWTRVTQQLRKYADATRVRHVIVLDEKSAIYFRFPANPSDELGFTTYLVATSDEIVSVGLSPLSMRELVVLVLLRALDEKGVKLCDAPTTGTTLVHSSQYRDVLKESQDDDKPSDSRKRPGSSTGTRQQPKRGKSAGNTERSEDVLTHFGGWVVNSRVPLEFLPDVAPMRTQPAGSHCPKSPDSGFHEGRSSPSHAPRRFHAVPTTRDAAGRVVTMLIVERVITDKAAVLKTADSSHRFIGKLFGLHPDTPERFRCELSAYAACTSLQGTEMPYLHGVCKVIQPSPFATIVMLIEFIDPGTTIADLVYDTYLKYDTTDDDELTRIAHLQESGKKAVAAIHERCVAHNDLAGRNLVVSGENDGERVVVVDFDCATVGISGHPARFERRVSLDQLMLEEAFTPGKVR